LSAQINLPDQWVIGPTLAPKQWKSYRFRVFYRGTRIEVAVSRKAAIFKAVSGPAVNVTVYGKDLTVDAAGATVWLSKP